MGEGGGERARARRGCWKVGEFWGGGLGDEKTGEGVSEGKDDSSDNARW